MEPTPPLSASGAAAGAEAVTRASRPFGWSRAVAAAAAAAAARAAAALRADDGAIETMVGNLVGSLDDDEANERA